MPMNMRRNPLWNLGCSYSPRARKQGWTILACKSSPYRELYLDQMSKIFVAKLENYKKSLMVANGIECIPRARRYVYYLVRIQHIYKNATQ